MIHWWIQVVFNAIVTVWLWGLHLDVRKLNRNLEKRKKS